MSNITEKYNLRSLPISPKDALTDLYIKQGKSSVEIAREFNRNLRTVQNWLKKYSISRNHSLSISLSRLDLRYWVYKEGQWRPKPSLELYYILGVLKGDGITYIYKTKYGATHYRILLDVTKLEFAKSFQNALNKIGIKKPYFHQPPKRENRLGQYVVCAHCMPFVQWYRSLTLQDLEKELGKDDDFVVQFLRGFYESEGSLAHPDGKRNKVRIVNTDRDLLVLVQKLINKLGFHTSFYRDKIYHGYKRAYRIFIHRNKETTKFIRLLNPVIKGELIG